MTPSHLPVLHPTASSWTIHGWSKGDCFALQVRSAMTVSLSAMKDCGRETHIHPKITLLSLDSNNMAVALFSRDGRKKALLFSEFKVCQQRSKRWSEIRGWPGIGGRSTVLSHGLPTTSSQAGELTAVADVPTSIFSDPCQPVRWMFSSSASFPVAFSRSFQHLKVFWRIISSSFPPELNKNYPMANDLHMSILE